MPSAHPKPLRAPALRATASAKPVAAAAPTQQSLKSSQTRARLIEATIRSIVKYGYAGTTTPQVAAEAGLSRGAMLHHFENGAALIKAAIVELHEKRLRAFRRTADLDHDDIGALVGAYWRQVSKPTFVAFHELALAARSNADLAKILRPLQLEFRERFNAQAIVLFPEWHGHADRFRLAMALSQTTLEGMAINRLTGAFDEEMVNPMLAYLESRIRELKASMGVPGA